MKKFNEKNTSYINTLIDYLNLIFSIIFVSAFVSILLSTIECNYNNHLGYTDNFVEYFKTSLTIVTIIIGITKYHNDKKGMLTYKWYEIDLKKQNKEKKLFSDFTNSINELYMIGINNNDIKLDIRRMCGNVKKINNEMDVTTDITYAIISECQQNCPKIYTTFKVMISKRMIFYNCRKDIIKTIEEAAKIVLNLEENKTDNYYNEQIKKFFNKLEKITEFQNKELFNSFNIYQKANSRYIEIKRINQYKDAMVCVQCENYNKMFLEE